MIIRSRKLLLWIVGFVCTASFLMTLGGCDSGTLGYMFYLVAPPEKKVKVPAEFDALGGRSVAIVIYVDQGVQYEYPYARLTLSTALAAELKEHVKNVTVVDPRRVITYQVENVYWDTLDKTRLGRDLGADFVLHVVLDEYTMREPGSINLYRGRIRGAAGLYETAQEEHNARVWEGDDFAVIHPLHGPVGELSHDDANIRYATEKQFTEMIARKFYKHKIPEPQ